MRGLSGRSRGRRARQLPRETVHRRRTGREGPAGAGRYLTAVPVVLEYASAPTGTGNENARQGLAYLAGQRRPPTELRDDALSIPLPVGVRQSFPESSFGGQAPERHPRRGRPRSGPPAVAIRWMQARPTSPMPTPTHFSADPPGDRDVVARIERSPTAPPDLRTTPASDRVCCLRCDRCGWVVDCVAADRDRFVARGCLRCGRALACAPHS
jgi:hypothetical protein